MQKINSLIYRIGGTLVLSVLCACQNLPAGTAHVNTDLTDNTDLRTLMVQNRQLAERVSTLEARQDDLERSIAVLAGSSPQKSGKNTTAKSVYEQAQHAFSSGQYARAITLLQPYSSGGIQDENAAGGLWLLALSHEKLMHCESAIQVAKLFARRYATDAAAPDAWLLVARCQIKMQQKDIARDTLRYLSGTYPNSRAARETRQLLK